ncbi:MAG: homoserine O-succinyltransferase [Oscillospiraceae bacterium]|jgi:homoserine O-succinyltransferase|nr:homoserine O-succinyltransferase [Oscillospiraceae bacterium]
MPINIPSNLPAFKTLKDENIFVMSAERALAQDIRALKIAIVNLMPTKIETETQLLRLLSNTPLQVDITLIKTATYVPKHASYEHMLTFYKTFEDVKDEKFDALVITGAPVEKMDFLEVVYWEELCEMLEWSKSHAFSVMHICWGAQAGLYYHYGVNKRELPKKLSGIYPQSITVKNHPLLIGFDEVFHVPQSRYTEIKPEDIEACANLTVLASSPSSGAHIIADKTNRQIFITGHGEYDRETLKNEYLRDKEKGLNPEIPHNYFPDDDPEKNPIYTWRGHASLLYSNWLNFCVYQETPFNLEKLEPLKIDGQSE